MSDVCFTEYQAEQLYRILSVAYKSEFHIQERDQMDADFDLVQCEKLLGKLEREGVDE